MTTEDAIAYWTRIEERASARSAARAVEADARRLVDDEAR